MIKKLNKRKCKNCGKEFQKTSPLQSVCGMNCALERSKELNTKLRIKKENKERKEGRESLLTHKDYLNLLQTVFNTFIRLRDKDLPCISCGTTKDIQYHAGHFYSVGSHPNLRFEEMNVHKQCVTCNNYKHGNLNEYALRLMAKIGGIEMTKLFLMKSEPLKLSIPEIKEKIAYYKLKIKEMKK